MKILGKINFVVHLFLMAFGIVFPVFAYTPLSGDIGGMTIDRTKSPYLVKEDIYISKGKTTVIKEGVVLLFESFTGLKVSGAFIVEGTIDDPVIFTSVNDAANNKS